MTEKAGEQLLHHLYGVAIASRSIYLAARAPKIDPGGVRGHYLNLAHRYGRAEVIVTDELLSKTDQVSPTPVEIGDLWGRSAIA